MTHNLWFNFRGPVKFVLRPKVLTILATAVPLRGASFRRVVYWVLEKFRPWRSPLIMVLFILMSWGRPLFLKNCWKTPLKMFIVPVGTHKSRQMRVSRPPRTSFLIWKGRMRRVILILWSRLSGPSMLLVNIRLSVLLLIWRWWRPSSMTLFLRRGEKPLGRRFVLSRRVQL